jgi:hypothetical protein
VRYLDKGNAFRIAEALEFTVLYAACAQYGIAKLSLPYAIGGILRLLPAPVTSHWNCFHYPIATVAGSLNDADIDPHREGSRRRKQCRAPLRPRFEQAHRAGKLLMQATDHVD